MTHITRPPVAITTIQQQLVGVATGLQLSGHSEYASLCMNAAERIDDLEDDVKRLHGDKMKLLEKYEYAR